MTLHPGHPTSVSTPACCQSVGQHKSASWNNGMMIEARCLIFKSSSSVMVCATTASLDRQDDEWHRTELRSSFLLWHVLCVTKPEIWIWKMFLQGDQGFFKRAQSPLICLGETPSDPRISRFGPQLLPSCSLFVINQLCVTWFLQRLSLIVHVDLLQVFFLIPVTLFLWCSTWGSLQDYVEGKVGLRPNKLTNDWLARENRQPTTWYNKLPND